MLVFILKYLLDDVPLSSVNTEMKTEAQMKRSRIQLKSILLKPRKMRRLLQMTG